MKSLSILAVALALCCVQQHRAAGVFVDDLIPWVSGDLNDVLRTILDVLRLNPDQGADFIIGKLQEQKTIEDKVQILKGLSDEIPSLDLQSIVLNATKNATRTEFASWMKLLQGNRLDGTTNLSSLIVSYSLSLTREDRLQLLLELSPSVTVNFTDVAYAISRGLALDAKLIFIGDVIRNQVNLKVDARSLLARIVLDLSVEERRALAQRAGQLSLTDVVNTLSQMGIPETPRPVIPTTPSPSSSVAKAMQLIRDYIRQNPSRDPLEFIVRQELLLPTMEMKVQLLQQVADGFPTVDLYRTIMNLAFNLPKGNLPNLIKQLDLSPLTQKITTQRLVADIIFIILRKEERVQFMINISQLRLNVTLEELALSVNLRLKLEDKISFLADINPRQAELKIDFLSLISKIFVGLADNERKDFFIACIKTFPGLFTAKSLAELIKLLPVVDLPQVFVNMSASGSSPAVIIEVIRTIAVTLLSGDSKISFLADLYKVSNNIRLPSDFRFEDYVVEISTLADPSLPSRAVAAFFRQLWPKYVDIDALALLVNWSTKNSFMRSNIQNILGEWLKNIPLNRQLELLQAIRRQSISINALDLVSGVAVNMSESTFLQFLPQVTSLFTGVFNRDDLIVKVGVQKESLGQLETYLRLVQRSLPESFAELSRRLLLLGIEGINGILGSLVSDQVDKALQSIKDFIAKNPRISPVEFIVRQAILLPSMDSKVQLLKRISDQFPSLDHRLIALTLVNNLPKGDVPSMIKTMEENQMGQKIDLQKFAADVCLFLLTKEQRIPFLLGLSQLAVKVNITEVTLSVAIGLKSQDRITFLSSINGQSVLRLDMMSIISRVLQRIPENEKKDFLLECIRTFPGLVDVTLIFSFSKDQPVKDLPKLMADFSNSGLNPSLVAEVLKSTTLNLSSESKVVFLADLYKAFGDIKLPSDFRFEDFLVEIATVINPSTPCSVLGLFFKQLMTNVPDIDTFGLLMQWSQGTSAFRDDLLCIIREWIKNVPVDKQIQLLQKTKRQGLNIDVQELIADVIPSVLDYFLPQFITQMFALYPDKVNQSQLAFKLATKIPLAKLENFLLLIKISHPELLLELATRLVRLENTDITDIVKRSVPELFPTLEHSLFSTQSSHDFA